MSIDEPATGDIGPPLEGDPERDAQARDAAREQERTGAQAQESPDARSYWSGYDLLWGAANGPATGRRPALDRSMIVWTAIRIADAEGLGAVSMRRVARELRTGAMSLYRHVPDKGALISLMVDEVIAEVIAGEQIPAPPSGDWRHDLRQLAKQMWAMAQRHPWYHEATAERPPVTPNGLAALEYALSILDGYKLTIGERVGIIAAMSSAVTALAVDALAEARGRLRSQVTEPEMSSAGAYLQHIVDTGKFPRFNEFVNELMNGAGPSDPQYDALELILDGIAARIEPPGREPANLEDPDR